MEKKTKKRKFNDEWFEGLTFDHVELFREMVVPLTRKFRSELFNKLGALICTSVNYEVTFSNYTLTLIARRILEILCDEWYNSVPLIYIEKDGKTLFINWMINAPSKTLTLTKTI